MAIALRAIALQAVALRFLDLLLFTVYHGLSLYGLSLHGPSLYGLSLCRLSAYGRSLHGPSLYGLALFRLSAYGLSLHVLSLCGLSLCRLWLYGLWQWLVMARLACRCLAIPRLRRLSGIVARPWRAMPAVALNRSGGSTIEPPETLIHIRVLRSFPMRRGMPRMQAVISSECFRALGPGW